MKSITHHGHPCGLQAHLPCMDMHGPTHPPTLWAGICCSAWEFGLATTILPVKSRCGTFS